MPFTVQRLIEGRAEVVTVRPEEPVQTALELMIEHDFSQLPVVDAEKRPLGLVTSDSILRALSNFNVMLGVLRVYDAMGKKPREYRPEDDLFDLLDDLRDSYAVLIVDGEGRLSGIVTSYDATEYFRRRAEDMMLVEDIESSLKDHIRAEFADATGELNLAALEATIAEITSPKQQLLGQFKKALNQYIKRQLGSTTNIDQAIAEEAFSKHLSGKISKKTFEDLTLYEYSELLLHKSRWSEYGRIFGLDQEPIRHLLAAVRQTRNALAHFRGEISAKQRQQLRFCADWLVRHPPAVFLQIMSEAPLETKSSLSMIREATGLSEPSPFAEEEIDPDEAYLDTASAEITPTDEALSPSDSRYAPLALFLQSRPPEQDRVPLTFEGIEKIIGGSLPNSARRHRAWWANDSVSHVQSQQWLDVGWRAADVIMAEQTVIFARVKEREKAYIDFFSGVLTDLRREAPFTVKDTSPQGVSWHVVNVFRECGALTYSFARQDRFRVELYIDTGSYEKNKRIYEKLHARQKEIESELGERLSWERIDNRRASRIALYHPGSITSSSRDLKQLHGWAVEAMIRFHRVMARRINAALPAERALNIQID